MNPVVTAMRSSATAALHGLSNTNLPAIEIVDVSKAYRIWASPEARLKFPALRLLARVVPHKSRLRDHIETSARKTYRDFYALKNISFVVRRGEAVGIIGRNGSGKSTLLQIIAGTLTPTTGRVIVRGRVAALLELGSGFNPEFTGRENVYMNAAILGLSRKEIDTVLEDILAFADIGSFIDQPIKTYSSGMIVRLAFAVQVQVNPDILIVDEALSVGDALFQKRCYQRIEQLRSENTTVLFVSHDQESVRTITGRAVFLNHGVIRSIGSSSEVVLDYRRFLHEEERTYFEAVTQHLKQRAAEKRSGVPAATDEVSLNRKDLGFGDLDAEIVATEILDFNGSPSSYFAPGDQIRVRVRYRFHKDCSHLSFGFRLRNREGVKVYSWGTRNHDISIWAGIASGTAVWEQSFSAGTTIVVTFVFRNTLGPNLYEVQAAIDESESHDSTTSRMIHWRDEAAFFHVALDPKTYVFNGVVDLEAQATVQIATS